MNQLQHDSVSGMDDLVNLIHQAQDGDRPSLAQLAERVRGRLYVYLHGLAQDHHVAEDLVQEVLLGLVQSIGLLRDASRFWPWLYRIAWSKATTNHRNRLSQDEHFQTLAIETRERLRWYQDRDILTGLICRETYEQLFQASCGLKPIHHDVIYLHSYKEWPFDLVADYLNCTPRLARLRFHRAKRLLRSHLSRIFES
jgi:RNA polymerase sigma factor (sigma-70 family)